MQIIENQKFVGTQVVLDDKSFVGCTFDRCTLLYSGGDCNLHGTKMENCNFVLSGAAQKTMAFLSGLGLVPPPPGATPGTTPPPQTPVGFIN